MSRYQLIQGDALDVMLGMGDASVSCCVTSPPYWKLRSYLPDESPDKALELGQEPLHDCAGWATGSRCGACYICHMTAVFAEVKRVLRDDGTCWVNVGDGYAGGGGNSPNSPSSLPEARAARGIGTNKGWIRGGVKPKDGLKPKDLCLIPQRLALSLQADGWFVRSEIIWAKKNPMPESVTDRPTKAHEQVWLLSKSPTYFYDADAVAETTVKRVGFEGSAKGYATGDRNDGFRADYGNHIIGKRNRRSVWEISSEPYPGAHFATFPESLVEPCILAGCPQSTCSVCGVVLSQNGIIAGRYRTNGNSIHLRDLQERVSTSPVKSGQNQVLQQGVLVYSEADREADCPVSGMRESCHDRQEGQTPEVLRQTVCGASHGEEQGGDKGVCDNPEGLYDGTFAVTSELNKVGVCDATPSGHGRTTGAVADERRSSSPQERSEIRQSPGESGSPLSKRTQPTAKVESETNQMPSLRGADRGFPQCPSCGSNLQKVGAIVPGVVFDPFTGSGTTGAVALRLDRRFIGAELNPEYIALAHRRIGAVACQEKLPLFGGEE